MFARYSFVADAAHVDPSGKVTALGIFDLIFAENFPVLHRAMSFIAMLEGTAREEGEHAISTEMRDDKGNSLAKFEQKINLVDSPTVKGIRRCSVVMNFHGLQFDRAGQYEFVMFSGNRFLCRTSFTVQQLKVTRMGE